MFRKPLTVRRKLPGAWANGVWVDGSDVDLSIMASVQPATPEDMQSLPEGRRNMAAYRLYTSTELRSSEDDETNPDRVTLFNDDYEITQVGRWQNGIRSHYRAIATKARP
ncbi:hypothetical protein ACFOGJ_08845 [Marinibaculum pumilum]|uniref:Head-tail adaptor protein n=1 Tax=Marinibaculum pumilum TaxID=1766165 RepID=A0ABV7KYR4_9PROT